MATTYMSVVNEILGEMNEVRLTSSTFSSAVNIQASIKEFVNRAYLDVNNPAFKWPWLAYSTELLNDYGNTYVEVSANTRWHLLKTGSAGINDDFGYVDWERFFLTTEGVAGETSPYTYRNLSYIGIEEWRDHFNVSEQRSKDTGAVPKRVVRSNDSRYFGLSPVPDKTYRVYFYAWKQPTELVYYGDMVEFPDRYKNVLLARVRYYSWQRKENPQQAAIALDEYEKLLKGMRIQTTHNKPDDITDGRIFYV